MTWIRPPDRFSTSVAQSIAVFAWMCIGGKNTL